MRGEYKNQQRTARAARCDPRGLVILLEAQDWTFPVPIAYGPGRLSEIAALCTRAGMRRPLVVTDRGSRELPFIERTLRLLADGGLSADLFSEVSPNPRDDEIGAGRAMFLAGDHDGVVAIGGGSGMDGGKAVALTARNDTPLMDFNYDLPSPELETTDFVPLICVPTTAGTGAETESTAMITDTSRRMKFCLWHPQLKPSFAVLDPELTLALPASLTAWTGCDAMIHAIEAYCVPGFHPLCDGVALEALRLIHRWLSEAVHSGDNVEARGGVLVGSCLAGIAFLKGLGAVHAISHMVGAEYDTHHGLTNAVALPAALRFNAPAIETKAATMAEAMGLDDKTMDGFYVAVCERLDAVGIPKRLTHIGVPADCAPAMAAKALQDAAAGTNPRPLTEAALRDIIDAALTYGR